MDDTSSNRCVGALPGIELLYGVTCSFEEARLKLAMAGSGNRNLGSPSSSGRDNLWQYQFNLESGFRSRVLDSDRALLRAREDFIMQNARRSSENLRNDSLPIGKTQLNTTSRAGISRLSAKKATNEKLKVSKQMEAQNAFMSRNDKTPLPGSGISSSTDRITDSNRTNLREWLVWESTKAEKVDKIEVFKQIVHLVDFAHSQGSALQDLRPSCFTILPSNKIQYIGSLVMIENGNVMLGDFNKCTTMEDSREVSRKRSLEYDPFENRIPVAKQKLNEGSSKNVHDNGFLERQESVSRNVQLEKTWYTSPEDHAERGCDFSSNIYSLGILLFELLCRFESWEAHSALMSDLRHRILPGKVLSESPIESAFCIWLLHPEPLSRPTTREILQSDLISGSKDSGCVDTFSNPLDYSDRQSDQLLRFFSSCQQEKERHAAKLIEEIGCLEKDIQEVERKYSPSTSSISSQKPNSSSSSVSTKNEEVLKKNLPQLEKAYLFMRSQRQDKRSPYIENPKRDLVTKQDSGERVGAFFDGLVKFSRFSKFKVCGTLRNGDLFNSTDAICSLSFDRDEEYIAAAKVSKKIKIFEFANLANDSKDIHYPVVEISNKSKLSCISWNHYIKNYLASADYDGVVKVWDASIGTEIAQKTEHKKRAWCVDFSRADPTMFASGSDDCSVRLWNINDNKSIGTVWCQANVCCVQFSDFSNHQIFFGSSDYTIYGYDLRHNRAPLCTLTGHKKAVSYVKFLDADTVVSASTDNTLKLWNLKKIASEDDYCSLSLTGHTNEKNFVGLSVLDGYIVCGSETNEVFSYYRSLPMPITSYRFDSVDPFSGEEISNDCGQFVSSVCWGRKSNTVVAANSSGVLKLLQMV